MKSTTDLNVFAGDDATISARVTIHSKFTTRTFITLAVIIDGNRVTLFLRDEAQMQHLSDAVANAMLAPDRA